MLNQVVGLKGTLLVVEDDSGLRDLIIRTLSKAGIVSVGVESGAAALERIAAERPVALLLDQRLPDMTGLQIIAELSDRGIRIPFIIMTGQGDERLAVEMMKLGASDYLVKDTDLLDILPVAVGRLSSALAREQALREAADSLRESEELNRSLLATIPDVVIRTDLDGVITFVNEAGAKKQPFVESDKLLGRNVLSLIAEQDRPRAEQNMSIMLEKPLGIKEYSIEINRTAVVCEVNGDVVRDRNDCPVGMVYVIRDVSDRKRAEEMHKHLQEQLADMQRMESIGRLAGGVAHDFNNMLSIILGHTEMLLEGLEPNDPLCDDLEEMRKAARRSADLTRQLLAFARKQTVEPRTLDLNETLEGMLTMLRRLIGEDIQLVWKPGHEPWTVKVDPSQIDQILANLCVNARDAMAGAGTITIETGHAFFDEDDARQSDIDPGEYVSVTVSDDGCGMQEEMLPHLFEPFFTTKETGKGTGLGLASVHGAVRQNNGFIRVSTKPNQGTTFTIFFPRYEEEEGRGGTEPQATLAAPDGQTILLVEDNPAILRMVARILDGLGYTVLAADDPMDALRIADAHSGSIDLLMTDVVMPEMNGRDLADRLQSAHPDIKRLFMSGYTSDIIAKRGVLDDSMHFIQKPFQVKQLKAKLREVLVCSR